MAYNIPWAEVDDNPTKSNQASNLDVFVRKVPDAIAERLTNMFSGFAQGETAEGIKRLEFIDQASDPADNKTIYTKGGEAYLKDGVDNIVQLTLNGVTNPPFDNVTIERVADALQIKGLGVTEAKLAAGAVTGGKVNSAIKDPVAGTAGLRTLGTAATAACAGDDGRLSNQRVPTDNSVTQAKCAVAMDDPLATIAGLRTIGTGALQACAGSDGRLSDQRTPVDGSVTTVKIVNAAVTAVKLASGVAIPAGTKMLFYQDTAPTGWTIQDTLDDKLVFVTKGSAAGGEIGGGVHSAGSWTISDIAADSHTLTTAEMPAHNHSIVTYDRLGDHPVGAAQAHWENTVASNTGNTGGNGGHTHTATHTPGWRPQSYCAIIASKN